MNQHVPAVLADTYRFFQIENTLPNNGLDKDFSLENENREQFNSQSYGSLQVDNNTK